MRIFGGEKIKSLMETFNLPDDQPIESGLVTKVVNEAQKKVEGFNFDTRNHPAMSFQRYYDHRFPAASS
jgi:preprotein translocase subunit SecA